MSQCVKVDTLGRLCDDDDGDQREFDLKTRVITNENIIMPKMFHSCALNK